MVTHHGPLLETGTTRAFKGHASPMSITQVINLKEIKECLHGVSKLKKKSDLNIASEASNVYITKMVDSSILIGQKLVENAKIQMSNFRPMCDWVLKKRS